MFCSVCVLPRSLRDALAATCPSPTLSYDKFEHSRVLLQQRSLILFCFNSLRFFVSEAIVLPWGFRGQTAGRGTSYEVYPACNQLYPTKDTGTTLSLRGTYMRTEQLVLSPARAYINININPNLNINHQDTASQRAACCVCKQSRIKPACPGE
jgi:hypothetical protein